VPVRFRPPALSSQALSSLDPLLAASADLRPVRKSVRVLHTHIARWCSHRAPNDSRTRRGHAAGLDGRRTVSQPHDISLIERCHGNSRRTALTATDVGGGIHHPPRPTATALIPRSYASDPGPQPRPPTEPKGPQPSGPNTSTTSSRGSIEADPEKTNRSTNRTCGAEVYRSRSCSVPVNASVQLPGLMDFC